ncbi:MAG: guanylate kinase [Actinomycetota bacterium]
MSRRLDERGGPALRGRLLVVSGPSGAGKGTVVGKVLERRPDVLLSVSHTTRPARRGEIDGLNYHFITEREFLAARDRGEYLETAMVYRNYYGTPRRPVEAALAAGRKVLLELDIQGALAVKRAIPQAELIFIEPPSLDELYSRLRGRGTEDSDALRRRVRAAYDEVKHRGLYDYIVVNDRLEDAVEQVVRILDGSPNQR